MQENNPSGRPWTPRGEGEEGKGEERWLGESEGHWAGGSEGAFPRGSELQDEGYGQGGNSGLLLLTRSRL